MCCFVGGGGEDGSNHSQTLTRTNTHSLQHITFVRGKHRKGAMKKKKRGHIKINVDLVRSGDIITLTCEVGAACCSCCLMGRGRCLETDRQTQTQTQAQTHRHTHSHTLTYTHIHTHTHTLTHSTRNTHSHASTPNVAAIGLEPGERFE